MRLIIADEISPDSCRLWDIETGQKLDKDVFRRDLGNLTDAYTEVARRLGVMPQDVFADHQTDVDQLRPNEDRSMKATVHVMLKTGVLDPQGEAVRHALGALGFDGVEGVRQGKVIELDLADGTSEADVTAMCEKLLANTVIESYRVDMT